MAYNVLLTDDAISDLKNLLRYIADNDSSESARRVLDRISKVIEGLSQQPNRGSYPKELLKLGIREYRETYYKPYRVIYRVAAESVYVYMIADGRRDLQTLLERRLLS